MNNLRITIIVFFVMIASACGSLPSNIKLPSISGGDKITFADDLKITLSRTQCYGKCPAYDLTILGNGTVEFNGQKYTDTVGKATAKITRREIDQIIDELNKANYLDLEDVYDLENCPTYWTDNSTVTTSVTQNGKTKSIRHYLGCEDKTADHKPYPPGLADLERKIDAIAGTAKWIGERGLDREQ